MRFAPAIALLWFAVASLLTSSLLVPSALGHAANESYVTIRLGPGRLTGQLDISRRDLHQGLRLSEADTRSLPADELARREEALGLDLAARLEIWSDGHRLQTAPTDFATLTLGSGEYARIVFEAALESDAPQVLELNCRALLAVDRSVHGLIRLEHSSGTEAVAFTEDSPGHRFELKSGGGGWQRWVSFVREGVWHIWIGFDHILFLVALLLPAVVEKRGKAWSAVESFRPALFNVLKVVTAFTVAHSVTLSLAALGLVTLPSRLVESAIAASVVLAATNNLHPWFKGRAWIVAFAFGLIHGFGFASVLGELGLQQGSLALALIGFNVGVEIGQVAIVAAFLPVAYLTRHQWFYRVLVLKAGSVGIIVIAGVWLIERSFAVSVLPF